MNREQLQFALQLKNRDSFIKTYIRPALTQEIIEYTIPEKPTSRNQKYRLTAKGMKLKRTNNK